MGEERPIESRHLLGADHGVYGQVAGFELAEGRIAARLSAGADPLSPSLGSKGDPAVPNEDALLAADDGRHCLLAVADAHCGHLASHELIGALAADVPALFEQPSSLETRVAGWPAHAAPDGSFSTLLIAVYDRESGQGIGLSYGDSSLVRITPAGAVRLNPRNGHYVSLRVGSTRLPGSAQVFRFEAADPGLLAAFTDGIDECHYRRPQTSVGLSALADLFRRTGPHPAPFADALVWLALEGIGGNPGGQDNIALVVSRT